MNSIRPLRQMERRYILRALELCEQDKKKCATALGISLKTLYNKLDAYGIYKRDARTKPAAWIGKRVRWKEYVGTVIEHRPRSKRRRVAEMKVTFDNGMCGWYLLTSLELV
jgi:hypothetical protein